MAMLSDGLMAKGHTNAEDRLLPHALHITNRTQLIYQDGPQLDILRLGPGFESQLRLPQHEATRALLQVASYPGKTNTLDSYTALP